MNRNLIPLFSLIVTLSATIFYFMQDNRNEAMNALFIGLYFTISIFLLLRILFYFRYKATINEMFFVIFVNIMIVIFLILEPLVPFSLTNQYSLHIVINNTSTMDLYITIVSLLILPYFILSLILQVRAFTKYEFFRVSPTSEKGLKAEWVAFLVYFIFGPIFAFLGVLSSDLLSVIFGLFYILTGITNLFAR